MYPKYLDRPNTVIDCDQYMSIQLDFVLVIINKFNFSLSGHHSSSIDKVNRSFIDKQTCLPIWLNFVF